MRRRGVAPAAAPIARVAAPRGRARRGRRVRALRDGVARHPDRATARRRRARRSARAAAGRADHRERRSSSTCSRPACAATRRRTSTRCARPATSCGSGRARSAPPMGACVCSSATRCACSCRATPTSTCRQGRSTTTFARISSQRGASFWSELRGGATRRHRRRAARRVVGSRVGGRGDERLARAAARAARRQAAAHRAEGEPPATGAPDADRSSRGRGPVVARRAARAAGGVAHGGRARARPPAPRAQRRPHARVGARRRSRGRLRRASIPCSRRSRSAATSVAATSSPGLGAAQFALPGAVDRLRAEREVGESAAAVVLAATDPAQVYGAALPWPESAGRPARAAGSLVVIVDGRGGRVPRPRWAEPAHVPRRRRGRPVDRRARRPS